MEIASAEAMVWFLSHNRKHSIVFVYCIFHEPAYSARLFPSRRGAHQFSILTHLQCWSAQNSQSLGALLGL